MTDLRLVDTGSEPADEPTLAKYWQRKYEELRDESTPATIRSLRAQLQSIADVLAEESDRDEMARRVAVHVKIGLVISKQR